MIRWKEVRELIRATRKGTPLGDIALMKLVMLGGSPAEINARLRARGSGCVEVDMDELRALPDGTVGRAYARHLDRNGLRPLSVSPSLKARFADNPYALRYTTTHDLFHVLTGFSTTPAGEIGLFAFMIAQGFAGGSEVLLWSSTVVSMLFMPLHARGALHNARVGLSMGKRAKALLEEPLETYLTEPLDRVRRRLGLPDPTSAGIVPGRESLLARWLLPKEPPEPAVSPA